MSPRPLQGISRMMFRLMGIAMATLFITIVLWLLQLLYFETGWEEEMLRGHTRRHTTSTEEFETETRRDQFHMDIPYSLDTMENPPVCFSCHTAYPHRENVRMRAYLNAHGTHLACEVCHYRPDPGEMIEHRWIDDSTDEIVATVEGDRGVYGAHVYPMRINDDGRLSRMGKLLSEPEWAELTQRSEGLNLEELRAIRDPAHDEIQGEPLGCTECHSPSGILDFAALGHDPGFVDRLKDLEVVQMLENTAEFHFPDIRGTLNP